MKNTIKLDRVRAIMLELTKEGKFFSFTFVTRPTNKKKSHFKRVNKAITRRKVTEQTDSKYKLYFNDLENPITNAEECWECLIVEFNGYKVIL